MTDFVLVVKGESFLSFRRSDYFTEVFTNEVSRCDLRFCVDTPTLRRITKQQNTSLPSSHPFAVPILLPLHEGSYVKGFKTDCNDSGKPLLDIRQLIRKSVPVSINKVLWIQFIVHCISTENWVSFQSSCQIHVEFVEVNLQKPPAKYNE